MKKRPGGIEDIDPVFMEGVLGKIDSRPCPYEYGGLEWAWWINGAAWAIDNKVTWSNILTKMLAVKDWTQV